MNNTKKWIIAGVAGVLVICALAAAGCLALGGFGYFAAQRAVGKITPDAIITQIATIENLPRIPTRVPTLTTSPTTTSAVPENQSPAGQEAYMTLDTLEKMVVPINDPRDLARRLEGKQNIPETMPAPAQPFKIGAQQTFWASNTETNQSFQVNATLRYITDHLYFWIEDGVKYDPQALKQLSETFENKIYPTDREFFGSEWTPGIDNDVHLYVLYAKNLGRSTAGYFSSVDELPPQVHKYSNAHEMFLVNADAVDLAEPYIYGVMAHEFQHMIHWYLDRNEESWLNEGFSVLAEFLNGYDIGGFDRLYLSQPDLQLTYWPPQAESAPHYGESFLFLAYFLDRFGDKATQAVVANTDNGMDSIDKVLAALNETDPQSGKLIQADDVFADWVVASYLNNSKIGDGRYAYKRYTSAPKPSVTDEVKNCSPNWKNTQVHQYGVQYIKIACSGTYTLKFQGSTEVGVLPVNAKSGNYSFWSNKGDESDMTLTRDFDFTNVSGPLTLQYSTWYDVEKDYDYVYLEVSEDGNNWQILTTPSGRDKSLDPSGNAYGWAYNDKSNGWIDEKVDLSKYAGKKIQVRFEYITDAAVNGEGFLLDDVRVPEINYSTDFEKDDGGWTGNGFVRIQNRLPQIFRLSLIKEGRAISVQNIALDGNQSAEIPLQFGGDMQDAVLVVSGVTRFTTQEAAFRFTFQK